MENAITGNERLDKGGRIRGGENLAVVRWWILSRIGPYSNSNSQLQPPRYAWTYRLNVSSMSLSYKDWQHVKHIRQAHLTVCYSPRFPLLAHEMFTAVDEK